MAKAQSAQNDWQVGLEQLRVALPACRIEMRSADYTSAPQSGGGRHRRAAQHDAGRLAAAAAGKGLTGLPCFAGRGPDGAPDWPQGLRGSISHCADRSVAMVGNAANWCGLGVDIEQHLNIQIAQEIAPVALTQRERVTFGADPLWVTLIFSAKESLFKALSPLINRRFDFDAAEMCADPKGAPHLRLTCDLTPDWPAGRMIKPLLIPCRAGVLTAVALPA
ncbi:4'-phosphopantetheinyl transferase family protein [Yoonia maritima]|uniref:4'-phosphopantetheinyl transferase family protein n=1 Tax=Yoonia maritima TaxID=1435347 RepID=UPI000D0E396A|nr:4'-phosphopantetheinyl transferase superfamily protein [Yoonia maritima]